MKNSCEMAGTVEIKIPEQGERGPERIVGRKGACWAGGNERRIVDEKECFWNMDVDIVLEKYHENFASFVTRRTGNEEIGGVQPGAWLST